MCVNGQRDTSSSSSSSDDDAMMLSSQAVQAEYCEGNAGCDTKQVYFFARKEPL